jgi:CIC family chloride channel protein
MVVPALGGLAAGLLMWGLAPEATGHGTDAVIASFHGDGRVRARVPLVKLVASIFTLGSGGSAGREGPMAQIGAGVGSATAGYLRLTAHERRLLLLAGAAAGISALFRAPVGASLWALEVLYREDFESDALFPCLVASVTGYSVFTLIYEQGSLLHVPTSFDFVPQQLPFYLLLGILVAVPGLLWIGVFRAVEHEVTPRLAMPVWLKPALGGLCVGALGLGVPWVLGPGYHWIQDLLQPVDATTRQLPTGYLGAALLLGIAVAKMLATGLTVGTGGSGGLFAPSLFIGAFVGGAVGLLFNQLAPGIVTQPGAFALVGMAAFYGGVAHAPLAATILVSEMFGSYSLLIPMTFATIVAMLILRKVTLYENQVRSSLESPAHGHEISLDVLEDLTVDDAYRRARSGKLLTPDARLLDFVMLAADQDSRAFVVRDDGGKPIGLLSMAEVQAVVTEPDALDFLLVGDAMVPFRPVQPTTRLRDAVELMAESGLDYLAVTDPRDPKSVLGNLTMRDVASCYRKRKLRDLALTNA